MKKIIFITVLLFTTCNIIAQTNYYTETKTFYEEGYTYQADRCKTGDIEIYNAENKWINKEQVYKETGEYFDMPDYGLEILDNTKYAETQKELFYILKECFSESEKNILQNSEYDFHINMYINPETGKVDDVRFSFDNTSYYIYIPVSTFRKIELQIKDKLSFTVTEEGKKLNYIYYWEDYQFK